VRQLKEMVPVSPSGFPSSQWQKLFLYVDGSCSGNPGAGGAGVVIKDERGRIVARLKKYLGSVTNNRAEYQALIAGLEEAQRLGTKEVEVYLDSELVVNQVNGVYRVRDTKLKTLEGEVRRRLGRFARWVISYIPREENREADRLAREAVRDKVDSVVAGPAG
jgi:ribonuclease HI